MGGKTLNQPIVGIAADPATGGYWEVGSDGGVFSYNAPFFGSTGSIHLNKPIVGMEASPNGQGYRFVASDGGIFSYGQAPFDGSTGSLSLAAPVVGMAADSVTNGYWMAAADGGIFTFGGAAYFGRVVSTEGMTAGGRTGRALYRADPRSTKLHLAVDDRTGWFVGADGDAKIGHVRSTVRMSPGGRRR